jgi:hypothetical protein
MSVGVSVHSVQAAATTSSGFTWADAAVIFVLAIVGLLVLVAFAGRRTRRLTFRPRVRTEHNRRIREAAEEDVEAIEDGRYVPRRDVPDSPDDDL